MALQRLNEACLANTPPQQYLLDMLQRSPQTDGSPRQNTLNIDEFVSLVRISEGRVHVFPQGYSQTQDKHSLHHSPTFRALQHVKFDILSELGTPSSSIFHFMSISDPPLAHLSIFFFRIQHNSQSTFGKPFEMFYGLTQRPI